MIDSVHFSSHVGQYMQEASLQKVLLFWLGLCLQIALTHEPSSWSSKGGGCSLFPVSAALVNPPQPCPLPSLNRAWHPAFVPRTGQSGLLQESEPLLRGFYPPPPPPPKCLHHWSVLPLLWLQRPHLSCHRSLFRYCHPLFWQCK